MSGDGGMCPTNPTHGALIYQPPGTREQEWAGESYACGEPGCHAGVLIMSAALRDQLRAQAHASRGWTQ